MDKQATAAYKFGVLTLLGNNKFNVWPLAWNLFPTEEKLNNEVNLRGDLPIWHRRVSLLVRGSTTEPDVTTIM